VAGKIRRKGKPNDLKSVVYDRRATDLVRGAQVAPIEVDDPMEAGGKLYVMRSTRDDPLADHHARKHIDEAQYQAGRRFQSLFERAERPVRAIDPIKEAVDGGMAIDPLTDGQIKAMAGLRKSYEELGHEGSAIIHDVLIHGMTMMAIASKRKMATKDWEAYFGKRFRECLDCLAVVYGFAMRRG
jgi:hypothetical protein